MLNVQQAVWKNDGFGAKCKVYKYKSDTKSSSKPLQSNINRNP